MIGMGGALGAIGIACILSRKTLLGVLLGVQFLHMGISVMFISAGLRSGLPVDGHIGALLLGMSVILPTCVGAAMAVRRFSLREKVSMDDLRNLKR